MLSELFTGPFATNRVDCFQSVEPIGKIKLGTRLALFSHVRAPGCAPQSGNKNMSRIQLRLGSALLATLGAIAATQASAVPMDYSIDGISGRFRFQRDDNSWDDYRHELRNETGFSLDDHNNEYIPNQPGHDAKASSQFETLGLELNWFQLEVDNSTIGFNQPQGFAFYVKNFLDDDGDLAAAPGDLGLERYRNVSFLLDMRVNFYENLGTGDRSDDYFVDSIAIEDFEIPLFLGSDPVTLNPGGWFRAYYEISGIDLSTEIDPLRQRVIDSEYGEGLLLSALVPDSYVFPNSVDPDPDPTSVPEPGTLALLALGLMGLGASGARRRRAQGSLTI